MFTLRQYLFSLADSHGLTRTLGEVELLRDAAGDYCYTVGNSAVIFPIRHKGHKRALRCYFRPMRHLRPIYGEQYLPEELFIYDTPTTGRWVDVVLTEWIEGESLQRAIERAAQAGDRAQLKALSTQFDRLAAALLADDWAHGDLKPDNMVVDAEGTIHLIDRDALYLPSFSGMHAAELGTAAFQHPSRTAEDFNERLDDYPAALIATALHALQLDPALFARYAERDGLLFEPSLGANDPALKEALTRFTEEGEAVWYRIGESLGYPNYRLPHLIDLFAALAADDTATATDDDEPPELFVERGRWGFRTAERVVIPPLYDEGFDFSEGLAAVRLATRWHFIDPRGRVALHCPPCDAVKPFRAGYAVIVCGKRRQRMDKAGELFDF